MRVQNEGETYDNEDEDQGEIEDGDNDEGEYYGGMRIRMKLS